MVLAVVLGHLLAGGERHRRGGTHLLVRVGRVQLLAVGVLDDEFVLDAVEVHPDEPVLLSLPELQGRILLALYRFGRESEPVLGPPAEEDCRRVVGVGGPVALLRRGLLPFAGSRGLLCARDAAAARDGTGRTQRLQESPPRLTPGRFPPVPRLCRFLVPHGGVSSSQFGKSIWGRKSRFVPVAGAEVRRGSPRGYARSY
jgi:hypothetical protein